jgi:hypothetical protein
VSYYRDGSRENQVLNTMTKSEPGAVATGFLSEQARCRGWRRPYGAGLVGGALIISWTILNARSELLAHQEAPLPSRVERPRELQGLDLGASHLKIRNLYVTVKSRRRADT